MPSFAACRRLFPPFYAFDPIRPGDRNRAPLTKDKLHPLAFSLPFPGSGFPGRNDTHSFPRNSTCQKHIDPHLSTGIPDTSAFL